MVTVGVCCAPSCWQRNVPVYGGVPLCAAHLRVVLLAAPAPEPESTVYYVERSDRPNQVKIGVTKSLDRRLGELGRRGRVVKLLATEPGGRDVERARHAEFAESRLDGEWFAMSWPLRRHLMALGV